MVLTIKKQKMENEMDIENNVNDGFAALDTFATAFADREAGNAPVAMADEPVADVIPHPANPKVDHRKGERKVKNDDGTISYGLKADGTPRSKPGRKAKPANAV